MFLLTLALTFILLRFFFYFLTFFLLFCHPHDRNYLYSGSTPYDHSPLLLQIVLAQTKPNAFSRPFKNPQFNRPLRYRFQRDHLLESQTVVFFTNSPVKRSTPNAWWHKSQKQTKIDTEKVRDVFFYCIWKTVWNLFSVLVNGAFLFCFSFLFFFLSLSFSLWSFFLLVDYRNLTLLH